MATQEEAQSTVNAEETLWVRTLGDEDGQQAGGAAHRQECQLGDLAGAVEGEQGNGACGHLDQTEDHLGQVDVHSKVRDVERQAIVDQDVDEPEAETFRTGQRTRVKNNLLYRKRLSKYCRDKPQNLLFQPHLYRCFNSS